MNKKYLFAIALVAITILLVVGCNETKLGPEQPSGSEKPSESEQPSEMVFVSSTEYDTCEDCHKKISDEEDYSLETALAMIEGHSDLESTNITECIKCHTPESDNSMAKILHQSHYSGDDNHYLSFYDGSCIHCHKLTEEGSLPVTGLEPENVSFIEIGVAQIDETPNGCEDCHKKISKDKDYSLDASFESVISKIDGLHVQRSMSPAECVICHGEKSNHPYSSIMHKTHLLGEHYESHGNSCISCHDSANGMEVKGL